MPPSPPTEARAAAACDCDVLTRASCVGLSFYGEHRGKRYCVLHYPGEEKAADFGAALKEKLNNRDYNFRGVWFPRGVKFGGSEFYRPVNFSHATFGEGAVFHSVKFKAEANFEGARFVGEAVFEKAVFDGATWFAATVFRERATFLKAAFRGEALFRGAEFGAEANFTEADFTGGANFGGASFNEKALFLNSSFGRRALFSYSVFGKRADFYGATFNTEADFSDATFADYLRLSATRDKQVFGPYASLNLQHARIERPDRVSFHTLNLRPRWFVNVDARKFEFVNVEWGRIDLAEEVSGLKYLTVSPHRLLAVACRNLAVNAEENHRYEEASMFRYAAMNVRRREHWRGFAPLRLGWWYWLASGYGERAGRAFLVLLGVWLLSALLYTQVGFARWEPRLSSEAEAQGARRDETGRPLEWPRAMAYSAAVMTLQKPEPRPATTAAQTLVLLETILGPVQAALLALAIRRKFMR
jgi:uncharacterized protein YjbI with pentapeptide repeats